jgi:hypothetical protein
MPIVSNITRFAALGLFAIAALAVKADAQGLPPLAKTLKPSETALILVDFQYPFVNPNGGNCRAGEESARARRVGYPRHRGLQQRLQGT